VKPPTPVVVSGGFDDIRSRHLRFLEEAAKFGQVTVILWPDETLQQLTGKAPKFPLSERLYFLNAVRYVTRVVPVAAPLDVHTMPEIEGVQPQVWVDEEGPANEPRGAFCREHGIEHRVLSAAQMSGFPVPQPMPSTPGRKKVLVTGCYDWLHTGHVRFTQEVSAYGDLYVVIGHDANIRLLKGQGHPLIPEAERRYMIGSIRYVKQALIASGDGWLDAEPDIQRLKPDIYAVNEDGDKGGKREYCEKLGIEYLVLHRKPAPGLPPRRSTDLRGF
jgi:cytidyltransferase-like protein